jgi:zinc transport system substrate-binding protein
MKRLSIFPGGVLILLLVLLCAGACHKAKSIREEGKITVTSLIFPSYDFVRSIAGDKVNLILLTAPGAESHSFEPSPRDVLAIQESDLFIYIGGLMDAWVNQILGAANTEKVKKLTLLGCVNALEEVIVEGMEEEKDTGMEEVEYDEHVWTSPKNAKLIVTAITGALCELDSSNADFYRKNASEYLSRLDEIDAAFRSVVDGAKRRTIVFSERFPFRYFAHDYGLEYFAAYQGCSSQSEPSATTVAFLINKIRGEHIPVIFHLELSNERIAKTISEETGAKKLMLHSAHNVSVKDFNSHRGYLDIQRDNVENLKQALW